jgi:predicted CoA-binding protein
MPTDPRELLASATTIAVVGASDRAARPAHWVPATLQAAGYRVIPVNPTLETALGERCRASLQEIDEHIDIVEVFRRPAFVPDVVRDAVAAGAGAVWLQSGITSPEGRAIAEEAGLGWVEDRCMAVDLRTFGLDDPALRPG